jgi:hypothetical protein
MQQASDAAARLMDKRFGGLLWKVTLFHLLRKYGIRILAEIAP